jgi:iron complex outermembrane recepter protein
VGRINLLYGGQFNQRKEFDIRRAGRSDRPAMLMRLFSNVLDLSLDHDHAKHSGSIGINVTHKYNYNDTRETGIRPLIPDYRQFSTGLFLIEKIRKKNWLWEAGARYDYQFLKALTFLSSNELIKPEFNFHYMSGSVGGAYYFNSNTRFNTHLGVSTRPPHVSELYSEGLHHGTAAIEEGLMRTQGDVLTDQAFIKNERSVKLINTLQAGSEKFTVDFSVYANSIANYIYLRPTETRLTIRGYFPVWHFEQTRAFLAGADMLLGWSLSKHLQYSGKFAYLHARDISRNDRLIFIPPANMEHSLMVQADIGKLERFFLKVSVPTVFHQSRAPRTVYPSEIPDDTTESVYDIAPAPPSYTLLQIESGIRFPLKDHQLQVSVSAENITNTTYRNYMNRLRYFADDVGRNFIVRLKYTFHSHD